MASVFEMLQLYQIVSFCMPCTRLVIIHFFQINTLYAGLLINIFYAHDLLAFLTYAFVIIFILILASDLLHAYKLN